MSTTLELSGRGEADRLLDAILTEAHARRATDVHLSPDAAGVRVTLRVDGLVHPRAHRIGRREYELLTGRLKVLADLNIAEHRRPQSGAVAWRTAGGAASELRVSFLPTLDGESTALRLAAAGALALPLAALGMPPELLADLKRTVARPSGLVLVAGPTGSGKSTTLGALAEDLAAQGRRVVTVEDPIERRLAGPTQIAVSRGEGLDFAAALRGVLRHDPDVVVIGEVRDAETASIALSAGLSGHMVLASLHADGPLGALERLVHLAVDRAQLVAVLAGILTQRLVRLACRECRGGECAACGGAGTAGRTGLFALFRPDGDLRRRLLAREVDLAGAGECLDDLVRQGRDRVERGETAAGELARVLPLAGEVA
jgi:general secretion pathway protein E